VGVGRLASDERSFGGDAATARQGAKKAEHALRRVPRLDPQRDA
jgi:hypothetical protein